MDNNPFTSKCPFTTLENIIQIIHIDKNHWAVISTYGITSDSNSTLNYYDSIYSDVQENAEDVISFLISKVNISELTVNCTPTPKQSGGSDCWLYAIAIATALAYDLDPATLIFEQNEMRPHSVQCLSSKN